MCELSVTRIMNNGASYRDLPRRESRSMDTCTGCVYATSARQPDGGCSQLIKPALDSGPQLCQLTRRQHLKARSPRFRVRSSTGPTAYAPAPTDAFNTAMAQWPSLNQQRWHSRSWLYSAALPQLTQPLESCLSPPRKCLYVANHHNNHISTLDWA